MKICFPVEENRGLESEVFGHFGSAPTFIIADSTSGTTSKIDNADVDHVHGACNPAIALAGKSIDAVITGGIGAGAITKLNSLNTRVFQSVPGTVKKNLDLFNNGELKELKTASCQSDHGSSHSCGHNY